MELLTTVLRKNNCQVVTFVLLLSEYSRFPIQSVSKIVSAVPPLSIFVSEVNPVSKIVKEVKFKRGHMTAMTIPLVRIMVFSNTQAIQIKS